MIELAKTKLQEFMQGRKLVWLANEAGIDYGRMKNIFYAGYRVSADEARRIAKACGVPISSLFEKSDFYDQKEA